MTERTPAEVVRYAADEGIQIVDLRFCDLPGSMQHFSMPIGQLTEDTFEDGFGFDGSSIRGFRDGEESDMILRPDPDTAVVDPFRQHKTLNLSCWVRDPVTLESSSLDPRYVAQKAEDHLRSTGIADTCYIGPEIEFLLVDDVRFREYANQAVHQIDSTRATWSAGRDDQSNVASKARSGERYVPGLPMDHDQDIRSEMTLMLMDLGIEVDAQHHEVGTAGHAEIDLTFESLLRQADQLMLFKYVVRNVAWVHGKSVTFMPKPIFGESGSGLHLHQSLWKGGEPLFYDEAGYAGVSDLARWYIGGLLHHARAVLAFTNPTTNSYKRLVPGHEAPVNLVYSQRNRSAAVRVPLFSQGPRAKRIEFRCPDPSCNPYLAFSAMLMAGLDGIQNRIEPLAPLETDLDHLRAEELTEVPQVPGSLEEALDALEADQDFLKVGGVFTDDLIEAWVAYKRANEVDALRLRPHPWEFHLYYDI